MTDELLDLMAAMERRMNREELRDLSWTLYHDPLARRYRERADSTGDAMLRTPEDVLGQRQLLVASMLADGTDDEVTRAADGQTDDDRWASLTGVSTMMLHATPHLWSEAGWGKLFDLKLPQHVVSSRALPQPFTWHTFPHPRGDEEGWLWALLICDGGECIIVTELWVEPGAAPTGQARTWLDQFRITYGMTWPDDFAGEAGQDGKVESTLQLLAFLSSPYIPRTRERMHRGARRELARAVDAQVDPEDTVTFVLLRRAAEGRREASESTAEVEWKHRWLVSGHLRAQWYPSEGAHHLIWVAPYMKGPEDAPLLEHVFKVAR